MSSKRNRPWNPDQMMLSPYAMRDALEEGHIVFRILDVIETLDISAVTDRMADRQSPLNHLSVRRSSCRSGLLTRAAPQFGLPEGQCGTNS